MWQICHFLEMTTTGTGTTTLTQLVAEYCELEKKAQSSFFPLTETAIDMFERGLNEKQVGKEFRLAFAEANGIAAKGLSKHLEYREFRRRILDMVKVAKRGRKWYEEHRAKETGFYRMQELAQAQSKPKPTTEDKAEAPDPEMFHFCKQLTSEGRKFLDSRFFTHLAVVVDSKAKGQLPMNYEELVTILKNLVATSSEALEKLEQR